MRMSVPPPRASVAILDRCPRRAALPAVFVALDGAITACVNPPPPAPPPPAVITLRPPPSPLPPLSAPIRARSPATSLRAGGEVRKRERVLEAWCDGGGLRDFRDRAVSRGPRGREARARRRAHPRGRLPDRGSAAPSRFHLFLPIDYPSKADADRALAERRISPRAHRAILAAHAARRPAAAGHGAGRRRRLPRRGRALARRSRSRLDAGLRRAAGRGARLRDRARARGHAAHDPRAR